MTAPHDGQADARSDVEVVIAGGGPVGLTLAYELGRRGISTILVEPRVAPDSSSPRCKQVNPRSMEHFRRMGIAEIVREATLPVPGVTDQAVFCTSVTGREISRFDSVFALSRQHNADFPEPAMWTAQYRLEAALRRAVASLPSVEVRWGARVEGFVQDSEKVTVELDAPDDEGSRAITTAYLVGADGARSVVRSGLGLTYTGSSHDAVNLQLIFRGDGLDRFDPEGRVAQYWVLDQKTSGVLGRLDAPDTWWAVLVDTDPDASTDELAAALQRLIGASIPVQILSRTPWTARMLVAERYRSGRCFLAGDAAHLNPPWGGFGANAGIGDAVDLGWKLAGFLRGWLGPAALDSYEAERMPIARATIAEAQRNMAILAPDLSSELLDEPGAEGDAARATTSAAVNSSKANEFYTIGFVLGTGVADSPLVIADDRDEPTSTTSIYRPSARPGMRLPHLWLSNSTSLYDLLGTGFSLVSTRDDVVALDRAARTAQAIGLPLTPVSLRRPDLRGLFGADLVLVRPDHLVAWRGDALPEDFYVILERVTGRTIDGRDTAIGVHEGAAGATV